MRLYVASSWRNAEQPTVVLALRAAGHEVYDFRAPVNDRAGFKWSDLGIERPEEWSAQRCVEFLNHPLAVEGFEQDFSAMKRSEACVLVLPAGRSANLEAGWFVGAGRPLIVLKDSGTPDLMYRMATRVVVDVPSVVRAVLDLLEFRRDSAREPEWPNDDGCSGPGSDEAGASGGCR